MKRCLICNSTYAGDDQFCHNDGSVLVADSSDTPTVVLPATPPRSMNYGAAVDQGSSSGKWMIPAIGILCGLVVVLGFFAFYRDGEKPAATQESKNERSSAAATPTSAPTSTPLPPPPPPPAQSVRVVQVNSPGDRFLALRSEPSHTYGAKLVEIPHGERISLGTCQPNFETIDKRKGRWCPTTYGGTSGWVFDAFVRY